MKNKNYSGILGSDVFTKSISVGDVQISSSLRRTQIEDIKAAHGMDLIQELEKDLVRELTETISRDIVEKVKLMANLSRKVDIDDDYETQNYEEWQEE